MKNYILILLSSLALLSCKARKTVEQNPAPAENVSSNKAFFETVTKKDDFESLKITSKVNAETDKFIPTIDGTFYIENDQKIWANFSFLFMSQARANITPTGIKAYEKINKTYIDSNFDYINNLLKVNFIDYSALQNLLLGKTFIPVNEKDYTFYKMKTVIC